MDDEKHVEGRMKGIGMELERGGGRNGRRSMREDEWNWKEGEGGMDDKKYVEGRMRGRNGIGRERNGSGRERVDH